MEKIPKDITYILTGEGWLYLASHKYLFTREIVGYAMAERMTKNLVSQSLLRAIVELLNGGGAGNRTPDTTDMSRML